MRPVAPLRAAFPCPPPPVLSPLDIRTGPLYCEGKFTSLPDMANDKLSTDIRREQITEAALHLLGKKGARRLKIADIAGHVGVVPSAIYRHFKSKDALLSAVLETIRARLFSNVESVRQQSDSATERLHGLLMRHAALIREERGIPCLIFSDELGGQKKERRLRLYRIIGGYLDEVAALVREGQEQGEFRPDLQPGVASRFFLGMVQPAALLTHMSDGAFDAVAHAAECWPLFLDMISRR